jgi:hypothetical protein
MSVRWVASMPILPQRFLDGISLDDGTPRSPRLTCFLTHRRSIVFRDRSVRMGHIRSAYQAVAVCVRDGHVHRLH